MLCADSKEARMLRIQGITKEEASEETRKIFEEQEKQYGSILNTAKVYGLRPTIQKGVQALQAGIVASGLISGDLRHLLCMKAASINGCPY
jgi:anti-sigma28 factor (negative regulator of flagellin synthesis)